MGKAGDTSDYDPADKYLAVPWDFEFGPPTETKLKRRRKHGNRKETVPEELGVSEVPPTTFEQLRSGISGIYAEMFDDLLAELAKHPEIFASKRLGTKAGPITIIKGIIASAMARSGLVEKTVLEITTTVGPEVINVVKETALELDLGIGDVEETAAIERFTERRMKYYEDIPDTLSDSVLNVLEDVVKEGQSFNDAKERLLLVRNDFTENRAEVIARTELGRSRREAKLIFGEKYSDKLDKRWDSTKDSRTRDSHAAMDGTVVPMDSPFIVPYHLDNSKYGWVEESVPGDSVHGIQCRCSLTLVRKK